MPTALCCKLKLPFSLITAFVTGEKDDNICYARCDNKIGESKVSKFQTSDPLKWTVYLHLLSTLLDYFLRTMPFRLCFLGS